MESKHPVQFEPAGSFYYLKKAIEVVKLNRPDFETTLRPLSNGYCHELDESIHPRA